MIECTVLSQELEEVSNKLIKAKMSSVSRDKTHSPAGGEQRVQQLQHKLSVVHDHHRHIRIKLQVSELIIKTFLFIFMFRRLK